jgi:hypothetical protein
VVVDELQITADDDGHMRALAWAAGLGAEVVWALEDCRLVAGKLERALVAAGQRVIRVPPRLMGKSRRGEREIGKSTVSAPARSPGRYSRKESSASRPPFSMKTRWRSGCCTITAAPWSASAAGRSTAGAGIS